MMKVYEVEKVTCILHHTVSSYPVDLKVRKKDIWQLKETTMQNEVDV